MGSGALMADDPPLSTMEDGKAQSIFIVIHFPMLILIFWFLTQADEGLTYNFQLGEDIIF